MEILQQIPQYGFWFLLLLTVLVFIHEMGHFLVARACGVRVEVFSIGFGPELIGWTDRTGTRWKLSWLPLGGYVRMFGQEDNVIEGESARPMSRQEQAVSFRHKSVGARMAIVFAGPAANYVFAILVFAMLYVAAGKLSVAPIVGEVVQGSPASEAGVVKGDRIASIEGVNVEDFNDIVYAVQSNLGNRLTIEITRNGQPLTVQMQPRLIHDKDKDGKDVSFVGLGMQSSNQHEIKKLTAGEAFLSANVDVYRTTVGTLKGLWQMIIGARSSQEVGGVLRIAKMSGDFAEYGLLTFIGFAAALSVNLGLINLFPVPLLDGGHLAYYAIEAVRGRPLGERAQEFGLKVGLALVLSLMLFATWNDLVYLKVVDFVKSLFT